MDPNTDPTKDRPVKETFNPPVDLPFDETEGGSPPYALPPALVKELAGKSEAEISSLLSAFRSGLSEHRTRLSEHRTDLSEHRTDLSDYRTELSRERTSASEHRTGLSDERSHLANERTHLAYIRTSVSLVTLGITLNRFAIFLVQSDQGSHTDTPALRLRMLHAEQMGLGMVILGVLLLLWGLIRYRRVHAEILGKGFKPPTLSLTVLTIAIIVLGAFSAAVLMLD